MKPFIQHHWNNDENYIKIELEELFIKNNNQSDQFIFSNLRSIKLESKKKLGPLIFGVVICSLVLIHIMLKGASLNMIGILTLSALILYVGLANYWVITIESLIDIKYYWINKIKTPQFPQSFINIIDFKIYKGVFPPMHCYIDSQKLADSLSNSNDIIKSFSDINYYLIRPQKIENYTLVKVDITQLNQSLDVVNNKPYFALGTHKINKAALMDIEL